MNMVVPTACGISKNNLSQIIHQRFGHVLITSIIHLSKKRLMNYPSKNSPVLEELCPICLLTKAIDISGGPAIDVSNFVPGFML